MRLAETQRWVFEFMSINKSFVYILFFVCAFPTVSNAIECNYGPECQDTAIKTRIDNPREWVSQCVCNIYGPEGGNLKSLTEFQKDITYDDEPELFIGSSFLSGNAGGRYFVFQKKEDTYHYLGSLMLHPLAFISLPKDNDKAPKMVLYWRSNENEGHLVTIKYLNDRFVEINKETIYPNGKDKERYLSLYIK